MIRSDSPPGRLWGGLVVAVAGLGLAAGPGQAQDPADQATGRMVCGPRCLEYVLHWYGKDEDVSDLLTELQNSRSDKMVSLAALADALSKRSVYTRAVRVGDGAEVDWPYPAIVHLTQPDGAGHFVVRVPPGDGFPKLWWSGEQGFDRDLPDEQRRGLTGVVLLTAPEPIDDPKPAAFRSTWWNPVWVGGAMTCGVVLLVVGWAYRRWSAGLPVPTQEDER